MTTDKTDTTNPISRVDNRLVSPTRVRQAKNVGIDVRLNQARRTFASLVATAESMPMQLRAEFDLGGLGKLKTGVLGKFYLGDEQAEGRIGFTLSFEYQGRKGITHRTEAEPAHNALRKVLYSHGLIFRSVSSATVYKLEVEAAVPAFVMVAAAPEGKVITITMRNVIALGTATYELPAEALDRKLVDALVELISRSDREFYALVSTGGKRNG